MTDYIIRYGGYWGALDYDGDPTFVDYKTTVSFALLWDLINQSAVVSKDPADCNKWYPLDMDTIFDKVADIYLDTYDGDRGYLIRTVDGVDIRMVSLFNHPVFDWRDKGVVIGDK